MTFFLNEISILLSKTSLKFENLMKKFICNIDTETRVIVILFILVNLINPETCPSKTYNSLFDFTLINRVSTCKAAHVREKGLSNYFMLITTFSNLNLKFKGIFLSIYKAFNKSEFYRIHQRCSIKKSFS